MTADCRLPTADCQLPTPSILCQGDMGLQGGIGEQKEKELLAIGQFFRYSPVEL